MAIPKSNIRGLQDIRTLSGRVDQVFLPYRAYLRIGCLEMEKARRGKEEESAIHRVKNIDQRCREIEAEKDDLLKNLNQRNGEEQPIDPPGVESGQSPSPRRGGLKFRY